MRLKVRYKGFDVPRLQKRIEIAASQASEQSAEDLKAKIQEKAEEYPLRDTGYLIDDSIRIEQGSKEGRHTVHIDAFYAGYLEYGTTKMEKHPFVHPAVKELKAENSMRRRFMEAFRAWRNG